MKILALELSSALGSIAWSNGLSAPSAVEFANDRKHSGAFFEQLQRAIRELPKPDRIVVGLGPGSYAGTRIAIAAATGLRAATGANLIGISSLRALAVEVADYNVVGDARRQSFYFAQVQQRSCRESPVLCSAEEISQRIRASEIPVFATESLTSFSDIKIALPSAAILLSIAQSEPLLSGELRLEPIYLRDPHITKPTIAR